MTRKAIQARRQKNLELTRMDRANRCDSCRRALGPTRYTTESGVKCCDLKCYSEYIDAEIVAYRKATEGS